MYMYLKNRFLYSNLAQSLV